MWLRRMNIEEWPFTEGFFNLLTPRMGEAGWHFCFFDARPWIFLSEDSSASIETLILELEFKLSEENKPNEP